MTDIHAAGGRGCGGEEKGKRGARGREEVFAAFLSLINLRGGDFCLFLLFPLFFLHPLRSFSLFPISLFRSFLSPSIYLYSQLYALSTLYCRVAFVVVIPSSFSFSLSISLSSLISLDYHYLYYN